MIKRPLFAVKCLFYISTFKTSLPTVVETFMNGLVFVNERGRGASVSVFKDRMPTLQLYLVAFLFFDF